MTEWQYIHHIRRGVEETMIAQVTVLKRKVTDQITEALQTGDYTVLTVTTHSKYAPEPPRMTVELRLNNGIEITIEGYCQ